MDPYLEGKIWESLHAYMIPQLGRQLAPQVRPNYVVEIAQPVISLEIRERSNRALVTAIEFLSPTNKLGDGHREYVARRSRFIRMGVNLVEIDLLRSGDRVPMEGVFPSVPYAVIVTSTDQAPISDIYPITLRQPLPSIPIPLMRGDPTVALDLQRALTQVYDEFSLDLAADYAKPPVIPLLLEDQAWADECLLTAGKL